jgi:serine protease Do
MEAPLRSHVCIQAPLTTNDPIFPSTTVSIMHEASRPDSMDQDPSNARSLPTALAVKEVIPLPVLQPEATERRLVVQRIDRPQVEEVVTPPPVETTISRRRAKGPDPITQSLMLLATMGLMLVTARYAVPSIVEEIRFAWHRGELRAERDSGVDGLKNVSLDALSEAYQMVTAAVGPSVVHIDVQRQHAPDDEAGLTRLLSRHPFMPSSDQGSGVVVDSEGFVLTNHHVIADGKEIMVTLSDGRRVVASVVGIDSLTDLAVLKIDADRLMPIAWGDSDRCKVGSPVWAVGSPFGLDRTVTFGILSGKHRMVRASTQYQDFMQSDVAVNPGNSGGPLVDARGRLVGINTAIVGDTYQGVSFSIPSNVAKQTYQRLRESGRVDRGWLGVALKEVPDDLLVGDDARVRGAIVSGLTDPSSPAAIAGLQSGDLILKLDGVAVRDMGHLMRMIGDALASSIVQLDVQRNGQSIQIGVKLGARPLELNVQ